MASGQAPQSQRLLRSLWSLAMTAGFSEYLRLRIVKLWVLLLSQMRFDAKAPFAFWRAYLWLFFLCITYRFFFQAALWRPAVSLGGYTIDFPLFLISGFALLRLVMFSVASADETISGLKRSGIIDWVLTTPTNIRELFFANWLWKIFLGITELTAMIIFANLLIGTPVIPFFHGSFFCALFLMSFAYTGIGMAIAGVAVLLRRGGSLCSLVQQVSVVFGGVFFPTHLFPKAIDFFSQILPITHALNVTRYGLTHVGQSPPFHLFLPLLQVALVYLVIGVLVLKKCLGLARHNGILLKDLYE